MKIGKGLASLGLCGLAAMMIHYKIDPCGMGILVFLGLLAIWESK